MKCPNCGREMKYEHGIGHYIDFSGTAEDWELEYCWEEYSCKACKITYDGNTWNIPDRYKPTEKQIKTILFINNHLNMDLEALTKHKCWIDIGKYFEKLKKHHYIQMNIMKIYKSILVIVSVIFVKNGGCNVSMYFTRKI